MKEIVFIHGLHGNAKSWQSWMTYFEDDGYKCYSPSYPFHDGVPSDLRKNPNKRLRKVRLKDVIDHYKEFISRQGFNPILIGHSMGGLIVQKLIQENIGMMGVCITSAAPKGILSFKWSHIKSNIATLNPLMGNTLYCGSKEWYRYAMCNTLTREISDEMYDELVVPESRNIARSSQLKDGAVDFSKPHKPLLFIGAENDHLIPVSLNRKNYCAYKDSASKITFKEFQGRSHTICLQNNWEEVAEYTQKWIERNLTDSNIARLLI